MALTLERRRGDARILCIGATASLAAGAMHVAAIAPHSEHRQAVWAFLGVALVQLVWGAAAVARPRRWLAALPSSSPTSPPPCSTAPGGGT